MTSLSNLFQKSPIFSVLDGEDREHLIGQVRRRKYSKDECVILCGEIWPYLFLVEKGRVDAIKESSDGRSLMVAQFMPGDIFWGAALFSENAPMPVTLEAREASHLSLWHRETMLPILTRNGRAAWELSRLMAERMQRASLIVEGLAFHPVAGRVARLLLEQAQDQDITPRVLTLEEMAARIGSTREMVCRSMQRFASTGLIEVTRTEYYITDRKGLEKLIESGKGGE